MKLTVAFLVGVLFLVISAQDDYLRRRHSPQPRPRPRPRPRDRCPAPRTLVCVTGCTPGDRPCPGRQRCCQNYCGGFNCAEPVGRSGVPRSCPGGRPMIRCLMNPCQVLRCPAYPQAVCINDDPCEPNCSGNFYLLSRRLSQTECHA